MRMLRHTTVANDHDFAMNLLQTPWTSFDVPSSHIHLQQILDVIGEVHHQFSLFSTPLTLLTFGLLALALGGGK